jgi:hypothetical protein
MKCKDYITENKSAKEHLNELITSMTETGGHPFSFNDAVMLLDIIKKYDIDVIKDLPIMQIFFRECAFGDQRRQMTLGAIYTTMWRTSSHTKEELADVFLEYLEPMNGSMLAQFVTEILNNTIDISDRIWNVLIEKGASDVWTGVMVKGIFPPQSEKVRNIGAHIPLQVIKSLSSTGARRLNVYFSNGVYHHYTFLSPEEIMQYKSPDREFFIAYNHVLERIHSSK